MERSKDYKKLKIVIDFDDHNVDSQDVLQIMKFLREKNCITYIITDVEVK